jgi:hypothetical protein
MREQRCSRRAGASERDCARRAPAGAATAAVAQATAFTRAQLRGRERASRAILTDAREAAKHRDTRRA